MFVCRACLRSLTGIGTTPVALRTLSSPRRAAGLVFGGRRTYHGKVAGRGFQADQIQIDIRSALAKPPPPERQASNNQPAAHDGEELWYEQKGIAENDSSGKQKYEQKLEATVRKQLQHFTDPFHIAQYVATALQKGRFDEALLMARRASRNKKVEVTWNHLIDYQMKNRRLHAAVKLYNEMKKRGQIPNAKTYTIIFRGCAESLHPRLAVAEATRIYNFMNRQGALKPNTIHMNAVLEVCARAADLDSLFTVLSTCNEGLRAPDAHTYTIVFNALRHDSLKTQKTELGLVDTEVKREVEKNIQKARAIWADVIARWRSAKVIIDEDLVVAMGRNLTLGDYKDNESVLDLVWQTMKIPRLDQDRSRPALPSKPDSKAVVESHAATYSKTAAENHAAAETAATPDSPGPEEQEIDTKDMPPKARRDLAASTAHKAPLYAKPGSKTLSLILVALGTARKTSSVSKYWDYFVKDLGHKPDPDNYYRYLRALVAGHNSAQVATLIEAMPRDIMNGITFRIAFHACVNDWASPKAFENACRIFDVMAKTQRYADPLAVRLFLHVARGNTRHFYERMEKDPEGGKAALGEQLVMAVDRVWEPLRILEGSLSYPAEATMSPEDEMAKKRGDMQEIMATVRRTISAIDKVTFEQLVTHRKTVKLLLTRRSILQRLVQRYIAKLYPDGPPQDKKRDNDMYDDMDEARDFQTDSTRGGI
ncbi:hypothetical protein C8A03DRAFT_29408 [Achaetomium macrosporum]|uniref:Pentatricopeptide repeat protein n=1 Tax=Achaetomium macrosporum TaxID=79813 RepID=A0AAN7HAC1_9PEZI|nr:hypothetical protein C8A03DRAFT_29408 [Achaetomium macrosporum]